MKNLKDNIEITFNNATDYFEHLQNIEDNSLWIPTDTHTLSVEGKETILRLPDEDGTGIFINSKELRECGYYSIINRCNVSGKGMKDVFISAPTVFADVVSSIMRSRKCSKLKLLVQGDKVSAVHSSSYTPISMCKVFENALNMCCTRFTVVNFAVAYWSWNVSSMNLHINDTTLEEVYFDLLLKHFKKVKAIKMGLSLYSSDTAENSLTAVPYLDFDGTRLPLAGKAKQHHKGEVTEETCEKAINKAFIQYQASMRSLATLAEFNIKHIKNACVKAFVMLKIPHKYCIEITEAIDGTKQGTALDVYTELCKCFSLMEKKGLKRDTIFRYEEIISSLISLPKIRWEELDVAGTVAYSAQI